MQPDPEHAADPTSAPAAEPGAAAEPDQPGDGLVFGALDEEEEHEVFSTPLSCSRASSLGAGQHLPTPPLAGAAQAAPTADDAAAPLLEDIPAEPRLVGQQQVLQEGSNLVSLAGSFSDNLLKQSNDEAEQPSDSGADASVSASEDETLSSTTGTSSSEQDLLSAPLTARQRQAADSAAAGASAADSGISQLSINSSSDVTLPAAAGEAEALPARHAQQQEQQQQEQQQQPDSPREAVSPLARLNNHPQQQQQQVHSPPNSPLASPHSDPAAAAGAAGLERAASWQLQHAAAAAAGTAAQPAPPRSDMHLTRLSSSPVSPACEDGWAAWQRHRRHFFVLTAAGKPVYSKHGDEQALAGFMAVIQALISVVADQGDAIRSITVGCSSITFLLRGSIYLVAVSSREEAPAALRRQLELLYQAIIMTVTAGVERLLQRNPGYDLQHLLAGSKGLLGGLLAATSDCPGWMMASVEPAAAAAADRAAAAAALQVAVKSSDALYGLLLAGRRVVVVVTGRGLPPLNVFDLLLLTNFTSSNASLRHGETFVPICLPNFQPGAFLHAYVACLDTPEQQQQAQQQHGGSSSSSLFLLLLSGSADAFHKLSAARQAFTTTLGPPAPGAGAAAAGAAAAGPGGVLARVSAIAARPGGGRIRVDSFPAPLGGAVGVSPLWHAVVRFPQRRQHLTLLYPSSLVTSRRQLKQLVRSYCRLYCAAYSQLLEQQQQQSGSSSSSSSVFQVPAGGSSAAGVGGGAAAGGSSGIAGIVGAGAGAAGSGSSAGGAVGSAAAAAAAYVLHQPARPHRLVWVSSQKWVTGVLVDKEVEVYVTFDPLTDKETGLSLAEQLRRLFADKGRQAELLLPGL